MHYFKYPIPYFQNVVCVWFLHITLKFVAGIHSGSKYNQPAVRIVYISDK